MSVTTEKPSGWKVLQLATQQARAGNPHFTNILTGFKKVDATARALQERARNTQQMSEGRNGHKGKLKKNGPVEPTLIESAGIETVTAAELDTESVTVQLKTGETILVPPDEVTLTISRLLRAGATTLDMISGPSVTHDTFPEGRPYITIHPRDEQKYRGWVNTDRVFMRRRLEESVRDQETQPQEAVPMIQTTADGKHLNLLTMYLSDPRFLAIVASMLDQQSTQMPEAAFSKIKRKARSMLMEELALDLFLRLEVGRPGERILDEAHSVEFYRACFPYNAVSLSQFGDAFLDGVTSPDFTIVRRGEDGEDRVRSLVEVTLRDFHADPTQDIEYMDKKYNAHKFHLGIKNHGSLYGHPRIIFVVPANFPRDQEELFLDEHRPTRPEHPLVRIVRLPVKYSEVSELLNGLSRRVTEQNGHRLPL